uniref:Ig-like domain-containing protein n=1 Tax=Macrostomum lignano TaxID=282301 RepID=A0A1I8JQW9_9PLAT
KKSTYSAAAAPQQQQQLLQEQLKVLKSSVSTDPSESYYFVDFDRKEARITEGPETLRVLNRSRAQFYCKAEGSPAPEIQWLVNGKPVRNSARHLTYDMAFGKILRIESVDAVTDRNLLVSCVAKNCRLKYAGCGKRFAACLLNSCHLCRHHLSSAATIAALPPLPHPSPPPLSQLAAQPPPASGFPRIVEAPKMQVTERSQRVRMGCYAQRCQADALPVDAGSEVRLDLSRPPACSSADAIGKFNAEQPQEVLLKTQRKCSPEDDGKYQCSWLTNSVGTVYSEPAHLYVRGLPL